MGLSVSLLGVILSLKEHINDKNVLSLGVQFPPSKNEIITFQKNFPELLSNSELDILSQASLKDFQKVLFKNILGAKDIHSLDISAEEGADYKELSNQVEELRLTLKDLEISQLVQWAKIQKKEENDIKEHLEVELGVSIETLNDIFSEKWLSSQRRKGNIKIKDDIKTELINLIVDDFKGKGEFCKLGKYNLLECKDINKPCIWDNERGVQECLDMDALTRKDEGVLNKPTVLISPNEFPFSSFAITFQ